MLHSVPNNRLWAGKAVQQSFLTGKHIHWQDVIKLRLNTWIWPKQSNDFIPDDIMTCLVCDLQQINCRLSWRLCNEIFFLTGVPGLDIVVFHLLAFVKVALDQWEAVLLPGGAVRGSRKPDCHHLLLSLKHWLLLWPLCAPWEVLWATLVSLRRRMLFESWVELWHFQCPSSQGLLFQFHWCWCPTKNQFER